MKTTLLWFSASTALIVSATLAAANSESVPDQVIADQRAALAEATAGKGYGPQSPRDIDAADGINPRAFGEAPEVSQMTLCDIHFHESAEHKGGEFTTYAGNGDGHGYGSGYRYDGTLTAAELAPLDTSIGATEHGDLQTGDTIEVHYVYSTAQATVGHGLGTCLSEAIANPQLRVESVVGVLVSDGGEDFTEMARVEQIDGRNQAPNLPTDLGTPVVYDGSTTGPGYNEKGSPYEVTWSVRPEVVKIDIASVGVWLADNPFAEDYAHGVRNLVMNPELLSPIN